MTKPRGSSPQPQDVVVMAREQDDVLAKKDHVTKSDRGLQIWDDETGAPGLEGQEGNASEGTAERSARITSAQKRAQKEAGHRDD